MTKQKKLFTWIFGPIIALIIVFFVAHNILINHEIKANAATDVPLQLTRQLPPIAVDRPVRILAIWGGGIYGIIPAVALAELEKRSGKPISELFDVIVGTSTGSIVAILLTFPDATGKAKFTAQQVVDFYNNDAGKMFYSPWYNRILTLNGLLGPKYVTQERDALLKAELGEVRFAQLLTNVAIPSYDFVREQPVIFYNWTKADGDNDKENFMVRDLLGGAISPPAYFAPNSIHNLKNQKYALADAAIFMNAPALLALQTAINNYPNREYVLVTLGTGNNSPQLETSKMGGWGFVNWSSRIFPVSLYARELLTCMFVVDFFNEQALRTNHFTLHELNIDIPNVKPMDDISSQNIKEINALGHKMVVENDAKLNAILKEVVLPHADKTGTKLKP